MACNTTRRWRWAAALLCALALVSNVGCGESAEEGAGLSLPSDYAPGLEPPRGSNVSFGGSQDVGFLRGQLEAGAVPSPEALDSAGFFAEHFIDTPPPSCGARVCVEPIVGVMSSLTRDEGLTMLRVGLKSPIDAASVERPPLDLAVVVDVSGSMQGDKIEQVRQGLQLLVDGMRDGDRLALVTYSDDARVIGALAPVEERRVELRRAVQGLVADGSTNIAAGLEEGYLQLLGSLAEETGRERRVVLLSDGVPTAGITSTPDILALSAGYNSEGIGLTSIGLGLDFNAELMRGLSLQGDGNYYFVEDAGAVDEVFEEELSFFLVPIAFDLELEIRTGESYTLLETYGAPLWQDTASGGRVEIPSAFLAHRESADDVTEDDGRRGGGSSLIAALAPRASMPDESGATIATIDLRYRDPETNEVVTDSVSLAYPERLYSLRSDGYFVAEEIGDAHKSFVMLSIYLGMEDAITAYHRGTAGAHTLAELDALIAAVEDYNEERQDTDIDLDLELLGMLRANLLRHGVRGERGELRDDPWPCD